MSMRERNSVSPEGVLDVGILVPLSFENPLKDASIKLISDSVTQRKPAVIPLTTVLGAYHIAIRYLRVPRMAAKNVYKGILRTGSPALHQETPLRVVSDALDYATAYDVESWDGYLIALCRSLGSTVIYSLDEKLAKVREVTVVNPFPRSTVAEYHDFIQEHIR